MRVLALETATDACSAALLIDGEVSERFRIAAREHAALLLPMVESLLAEAGLQVGQLDALAFGRGPGAFTGVRIAAGMAQGIAFGADLPVVPVSTLATLAQSAARLHQARRVLAALDARMQEVYWGAYSADNGLMRLNGTESVCNPQSVPAVGGSDWVGAGSGWERYRETLAGACTDGLAAVHPRLRPHAHDLAQLAVARVQAGDTVAPERALPVYLRDKVAQKPSVTS